MIIRPFALLGLAAIAYCSGGTTDRTSAIAARTSGTPLTQTAARTSPHWRGVRVAVSDYRIVYQSDSVVRAREFDWAASHFDRVTLDKADPISVAEYKRRNPTAWLFRYAILWTVVQPGEEKADDEGVSYYASMQRWFAAQRGLELEHAFLHDGRRCPPPAPVTAACRVSFKVWTQQRWATNPGDSGARAYHAMRLGALAGDVEGLFIDEHGSGDITDKLRGVSLREYDRWEDYERDVVALLEASRAALGKGRVLMLNTAEYRTPWDRQMIAVAGGTHAEHMNDPVSPQMESRWRFLEDVIRDGAIVNVSPKRELPASYDPGNSPTATDRRQLWELASYYLLVSAGRPDAVAFNPGPRWDKPYAERWIGAIEKDIGRPLGARTLAIDGTGPDGAPARVWMRDFEHAVVLARPASDKGGFGAESAVSIPFATGGLYRPLRVAGTVGDPLRSLSLRAGEAAILIKPLAP